MNKIFFLIATGLMVSSLAMGNVTTPDDEAKFQVLQTGSVVRVLYKAATNNDVKIFIYDAKNGKVFSEILNNTSGFVRPYNLANLPIGNYVVVVWDGNYEFRKSVHFSSERKPVYIDLDKVSGAENKFLVRVAKGAAGYHLRISGEHGEVIFNEQKRLGRDFAQVYDVSKLKGPFVVELTDLTGYTEKLSF